MEGTHVSVGITLTELQRHNVLAPAVRGRVLREREDAFTLRGFRSPVCDIIAVFSDVVGTHETLENEDLLPLGPQSGGLILHFFGCLLF